MRGGSGGRAIMSLGNIESRVTVGINDEGANMIGFTAALWIALQAAGAVPAPEAEMLEAPLPSGFKIGFADKQSGQTIEERVPVRETVEAWSRMITVQRFSGLARIGPHAMLEKLGSLMIQACPGAIADPIEDASDGGHVTAAFRVTCPLNPATGKPETMLARAFAGDADIHLVQYAYRAIPSPKEASAATAYLGSVRLKSGSSSGK
ncbi:hypothetical protein HL653_02110 [Sphingomonas sp. AP4-R1]|uniref:hypothetical protein n=1 Tax=Sphingomonas sp. AP4-R1 TaxID=2735134 RepID=UPI001493D688|nr:hypothetical protein [Sphingomonas sp. AP4-R1]QJU56739.1 hypothetical protein HL653_02110 [Sphingomonas sp. AP4-R1]